MMEFSLLQNISLQIVSAIGSAYVLICLLRVWMQLAQVDRYNPISQFIFNATQPPVAVLQKIIPNYRHFNSAALLWAVCIQVLVVSTLIFIINKTIMPAESIAWGLVGLTSYIITMVRWTLIIVILVSLVGLLSGRPLHHPVIGIMEQLIRPILLPINRVIPPMGGLDLSPLVAFLVLGILDTIVLSVAASLYLNALVVPGI